MKNLISILFITIYLFDGAGFGQMDQGYSNFFGFDQPSMRMGFDFGILQNLMLGFGRSS